MIRIRNYWKLFNRIEPNEQVDIQMMDTGSEPVTLADFKEHARITHTDDDAYIPTLITAARQTIEKYCGISIVDKDITLHVKNVYEGYELPYGPVISITTTVDSEGDALEIETGGIDYTTILTGTDFMNVAYTTGWSEVPEDLKLAIKQQALWLYEHRGDEMPAGLVMGAKIIANQYKRITWLA